MTRSCIIIGGGIVGVSTALALQNRGQSVLLIERNRAVQENSHGNAGVITMSSIVAMNNPALLPLLPSLALNKLNSFRYSSRYALSEAGNLLRFLLHSRKRAASRRATALHQLIIASRGLHKLWLKEAGRSHHIRNNGWLQLYQTENQFKGSRYLREILAHFSVKHETLTRDEITELEPHISPFACKGLWVQDASSVDNPALVTEAYKSLFIQKGGEILQNEVRGATQIANSSWQITTQNHHTLSCENLVVALGPWSKSFLEKLSITIPMIFERGAHRQYSVSNSKTITRPILDTSGGYVVTPVDQGIRLTCGVELNYLDAPYSMTQLNNADATAKTRFPLAQRCSADWIGARPTLPDCLPMIGKTHRDGLWVNTGHQHVGFSTGPISGEILASMMTKDTPTVIDTSVYSPSRYGC